MLNLNTKKTKSEANQHATIKKCSIYEHTTAYNSIEQFDHFPLILQTITIVQMLSTKEGDIINMTVWQKVSHNRKVVSKTAVF